MVNSEEDKELGLLVLTMAVDIQAESLANVIEDMWGKEWTLDRVRLLHEFSGRLYEVMEQLNELVNGKEDDDNDE